MPAYRATYCLFAITISLSGLLSPWALALIALFHRNCSLLLGAMIALSLSASYTAILPASNIVLCDLSHCHWTIPESNMLSFFLREARVKIITPERPGFYELTFPDLENAHRNSTAGALFLSYLPELSAKYASIARAPYWATAQATDAIIYGKAEPNNMLSSLFGRFGASHLLCLSAWHVGIIRRYVFYKPLCILVLITLLFILQAPFPLLRASIATLLPRGQQYHEQIESWSLSWLLGLLLSPFAWTTWSFWLSFYYGAIFLYTRPNMLALRLSNLVWISVWNIDWDPLALVIGIFLEPVFVIILIMGWISYPLSFIFPEIINFFWDGIFQLYVDYSFLGLALPSLPVSSSFLILFFFVMPPRSELIIFEFLKNKKPGNISKFMLNGMI